MSVTLLVVLLLTLSCVGAGGDDSEAKREYDYIVVGLGAAGCIIASRLAEHGSYTVLGIESGGRTQRSLNGTDYVASSFYRDHNGKVRYTTPLTRFDVPALNPTIYTPPAPYLNWPFVLNGATGNSNAGRLLGGSGVHNGLVYSRLTKATLDSWGVDGWRYADVLPFYKKLENVTDTLSAANPAYHGFSGPIKISDPPNNNYWEAIPIFIDACANTGLPRNLDFNGPTRVGCGFQVANVRRGIRDSSANAYLSFAVRTGNPTLELHALVSKIIIEKVFGKPRAVGVEYIQGGVSKRVYARKEVILSGGPLNTPRLLQLSGIGPKALLEGLGIHVWVANDNVGKHLGNNQNTPAGWTYPSREFPSSFQVSSTSAEYALNGTGVWSFPPNFGYTYACLNGGICADPEVMIGCVYGNIPNGGLGTKTLEIGISTSKPKTRGVVQINSTDPFDSIRVTIPIFTQEDINATIYGLQLLRKIMNTYPANVTFISEIIPGPTAQTYEDFVTYVTTKGHLIAHWHGSARVGNRGDPLAVVDTRLRVVGIDGLRVGDASIMVSMNSHPHATALMIGEKAAHLILEDA